MAIITGRQIRAARSLLDMKQGELAEQAGLSTQSINGIESGSVQPREGTLTEIEKVFAANGIEFLPNEGVGFRPEGIQILEGRNGLIALMEDIYDTCKKGKGGDVVLAGAPEKEFVRVLGDYDETYLANMSSIKGFKMRTLIQEGDKNTVSSAYTEYRWSAKGLFDPVPFYAFGDKLAIVVFQSDSSPRVYVIQSKTIADAYRLQFESMWKLSNPTPKGAKK